MDHPTYLTLQDVRCFGGTQIGRIRPITLLVGENSTGKSTFLGGYSALHRLLSGFRINESLDFNEAPFAMGSFRDIVRSRRGRGGRINEFKLGIGLEARRDRLPLRELTATFGEIGSQPTVSSLRLQFDEGAYLELRRSTDNGIAVQLPNHPLQETNFPFDQSFHFLPLLMEDFEENDGRWRRQFPNLEPVYQFLRGFGSTSGRADGRQRPRQQDLFDSIIPILSELIPVAPLRSKPKRTYDPVREIASPDGEHVPMLMMRLDRTDKKHWNALHDALVEFGRDAGLFSDIKAKGHGKQMSDPFQLQVKVRSGPHANIMDVGYGISQSLPILVDVLAAADAPRRTGARTFLLQQPEVHLHPRGQAQLASLFIQAFKERRSRFLIETHSDHIVDRVRISVRKGLLEPDDVSILYFDLDGNNVAIHNMHLDQHGNLEGAPAGYREFFLRETDELLGFED